MKLHPLYLVLFLIIVASCKSKSEFEGFSKSSKGFHYQLHSIGEEDKKMKTGDYITADIAYKTIQDSVFFEGRRKLKLSEAAYRGAIEDCFKMLNEGENATFILLAEPFFSQTLQTSLPSFFKIDDFFKVDITVIEIQSANDFEKEKQAFLNWIEDFGDYEKIILKQYLTEEKLSIKPIQPGLYYLPLVENDNPKIEIGDTITINYEGRFLNGKFFDSTKKRNQPFQFVYGTEWQVIQGIENGLALMGEDEKALFILNSDLAFGKSGSSTGIIPPYTSTIFEVEVLQVIKGATKQ